MITSLYNPLIKHLVKLREDKKYRQEKGSIVVSGKTLVSELSCTHPFETLIVTNSFPSHLKAKSVIEVSLSVMKKIVGVESPEQIAAEIRYPKEQDVAKCPFLLVLDRVSDPGNLGTLLRTALALGWDGVFLTSECVDLWNDKVVRASRGAPFFLPVQTGSQKTLMELLEKRGGSILVADASGKSVSELSLRAPLTLILGNESHGPLESLKHQFVLVGVPLSDKMESLNVAVAGGILMDQLRHHVKR